MLDCALYCGFDRLLSVKDTRTKIFSSRDAPALSSGSLGVDYREDGLAPYFDDGGDIDHIVSDVPMDSHIDVPDRTHLTSMLFASSAMGPTLEYWRTPTGVHPGFVECEGYQGDRLDALCPACGTGKHAIR